MSLWDSCLETSLKTSKGSLSMHFSSGHLLCIEKLEVEFLFAFFVFVFYLQLNSDADALGLYKPNILPLDSLPNEIASVYQSKNVYRPLAKVIEQLMGLSNG